MNNLTTERSIDRDNGTVDYCRVNDITIQAIAGTMNPLHLKEICYTTKVDLTHNEWYKLYLSSGKKLP